jgi:hypothetical protein
MAVRYRERARRNRRRRRSCRCASAVCDAEVSASGSRLPVRCHGSRGDAGRPQDVEAVLGSDGGHSAWVGWDIRSRRQREGLGWLGAGAHEALKVRCPEASGQGPSRYGRTLIAAVRVRSRDRKHGEDRLAVIRGPGKHVLVAAPSPAEVVAWLSRHQQRAQSVFRVVGSEQAIAGAAPQ